MKTSRITLVLIQACALMPGLCLAANPTVGTGDISSPAVGPRPAYDYDEARIDDYVLVKNWDFGQQNGTIRNINEMSNEFQYHDQFGTIANGTKYGAFIVAPDKENAINGQPIEGVNTDRKVREFTSDSLKTFLVGLDGSKEVHPTNNKAGNGSFQAKWTLPRGGSHLGQDLIWETRVRYKTPPYFWFAIWTAGNKWNKGAEMDLIESFGWDNGGGSTNYDGDYWHSSLVKGKHGESETNYHKNWGSGMKRYGIENYDASDYHTWTWVYRADDTFSAFVDGKLVQQGKSPWTLGADVKGEPLNMSFIFDGSWGHRQVSSVNHPLDVEEFQDKFYEWDYSRVYLRNAPDAISAYKGKPLQSLNIADDSISSSITANHDAKFSIETASDGQKQIIINYPTGDYPGISIEPINGFDFSAYHSVQVTLKNAGDHPVSITARVDNEGNWRDKPYSAEATRIDPGDTKVIDIQFGKTFGKTGHNLDTSKIKRIMLFANNPAHSGSLVMEQIATR